MQRRPFTKAERWLRLRVPGTFFRLHDEANGPVWCPTVGVEIWLTDLWPDPPPGYAAAAMRERAVLVMPIQPFDGGEGSALHAALREVGAWNDRRAVIGLPPVAEQPVRRTKDHHLKQPRQRPMKKLALWEKQLLQRRAGTAGLCRRLDNMAADGQAKFDQTPRLRKGVTDGQ